LGQEPVENPPAESHAALWRRVMENLEKELSEVSIDRWFRHLHPSAIENDTLVIDVPDDFFRKWIVDHYLDHITSALAAASSGVSRFELKINPRSPAAPAPAPAAEAGPVRARPSSAPKSEQDLNPRYTFDEFVIGPSNRFAYAAALAVSEQPAKTYNPLFIHGPVGLGKTHLMQAIGHEIQRRNPQASVLYITSEKFTNELINSIQNRATLRFREKFRGVDILLIDDIHFIGGKEATQEEFFHTFNSLYDSHKQIVVSSDRPPKEISHLEERLVSRFEWGLVTDIQPADFETRAAILRKKALREKIKIPDAVTCFIAEKVQSNIRELEGALNRVIAYSHFAGRPISDTLAHEALKNFIQESERKITIHIIQKRVADHFNLKTSDLTAKRRTKNIVLPRQIAMYLCRTLTEHSLPEIGSQFGGRDHSTVLHACEKVRICLEKDGDFRLVLSQIQKNLAQ
jgi:chromosomal replication initiator protein